MKAENESEGKESAVKAKIRPPFFEIGVKNYIYGDDVLELAKAADRAAMEYDIDVLFLAPYADIRRVRQHTCRLVIFAPYMDALRPGRGMADVLPESVRAAGAQGVVLNHCERPMSLGQIEQTMRRAKELEMLTFLCADTLEETRVAAQFHPDILNPEQAERIGKDGGFNPEYAMESIREIRKIDPNILIEQASGIRTGQQVYDLILMGADGVGAASGIVCSPDPCKTAEEMIRSVRMAKEERDRDETLSKKSDDAV